LIEVDGLNEDDTKLYKESGITPLTTESKAISKLDQYSPLDAFVKFFKSVHAKEDAVIRVCKFTNYYQANT